MRTLQLFSIKLLAAAALLLAATTSGYSAGVGGGTTADLQIGKTASTTQLNVGQQMTFTLNFTNAGPNTVTNVTTISDFLPFGFQYINDNGGGSYSASSGTWTITPGPSGAIQSLIITAQAVSTGRYTNTATINVPSAVSDPNFLNNTSSVGVTIALPTADLQISQTASTTQLNVGQQMTLTLHFYNAGPNSVTNSVTVYDSLPFGLQYVSDNGGGSYSSGSGQWTVIPGASGATQNLTITVQAVSTGSYSNTAVFFDPPGINDPNSNNNTSSVPVTITLPTADLQISQTASTTQLNVGQQMTFTLHFYNPGSNSVTNSVTVYDFLPSGLRYISDNGGGSYNSGSGTWTITPGSSGATQNLTITVQAISTGAYSNTAIFFDPPGINDPNSNNNTSSVPVMVTLLQADLQIGKTASTTQLNVGQQMTFTLNFTNAGPGTVTNTVTVNDLLPAGFEYVSDNGTGLTGNGAYSAGLGQWTLMPGGSGAVQSLTITVKATNAGFYTNIASIVVPGGVTDPNLQNNSAQAFVDVATPQADLQVTKSASTNTVKQGQQVVFTVLLQNLGPASISNDIVVNDCLPNGFEYVTDSTYGNSTNGIYSPGTCMWTYPALGAGSNATLQITVTGTNIGTWTNVASVTVPNGVTDPNTNNNISSSVVSVTSSAAQADLQVTKTASTNALRLGQQVVFTILLTNLGPDLVTNDIIVTDCLPAGFTYVTDNTYGTNVNGVYSPGTCWWTWSGGLATNTVAKLLITAQAIATNVYTNTATVGVPAGVMDPNLSNNVSSAVVTNTSSIADLQVTKSLDVTNLQIGGQATFTVTLQNLGPDSVTNPIVVTDCLPDGLQYMNDNTVGNPSNGVYSAGLCQWTLANGLATNTPMTLTITVLATTNTCFTNTATVAVPMGVIDPNTNNNTASVQSCINPRYTLTGFVRGCQTNGVGLQMVTVTLTGPTNLVTTTDTNGAYSFSNLFTGAYTIIPTQQSNTFSPSVANVMVNGNTTAPVFTGNTSLVNGRVTYGTNGPGVSGITVALKGGFLFGRSRIAITDSNGNYVFANVFPASYTIMPLATNGFTFYPPTNAMITLSATNCSATANFVTRTRTVQMIALEVNQAIQDWGNSVQLIAAKSTFARVHLQLPVTNMGPVLVQGARLYGMGPGGALPGSPLSSINTNGSLQVQTTNAADFQFRKFWTNSLDFELPASWCAAGNISLQFVWTNNSSVTYMAPNKAGGTNGIVQCAFVTTVIPNIKIYGFNWTNSGTYQTVNLPEYNDLPGRFTTIYPVPDATRATLAMRSQAPQRLFVPPRIPNFLTNKDFAVDNLGDLALVYANGKLIQFQSFDMLLSKIFGGATNWIYYGAIANPTPGTLGWAGAFVTTANMFREDGTYVSSGFLTNNFYGVSRQTAPHEIGHNIGLPHTFSAGAAFPYNQPISTIAGADNTRAALGPMSSGTNSLIYGLDTLTLRTAYPTNNDLNPIPSPFYTFEMMSYDRDFVKSAPPNNAPLERWISPFTYNFVRSNFNKYFAPPAAPPAPGPMKKWFFVRGIFDPVKDTGALLPMWSVSSDIAPVAPPGGPFMIEAFNSSGQLVEEVPFQIAEFDIEERDPGDSEGDLFDVPIEADPSITQIQVWDSTDNILLATANASTNMPSVSSVMLADTNGISFTGTGMLDISWQGLDADTNAQLIYTVQYSPDGGTSWETLDVDSSDLDLQLDSSALVATTQGYIRVLASDGFNTSEAALSSVFSIPNHPPSATIINPLNGAIFAVDQQIFLEASVTDPQDGVLDGANVQWSSSLDGSLGSGDEVNLEAGTLSEGAHTITVTAIDSLGLSTTNSLQIFVLHQPPPQLSIDINSQNIDLNWPASYTNYVLESSGDLAPPATWSGVTNTPEVMDSIQTVTLPVAPTNVFFRLRMP